MMARRSCTFKQSDVTRAVKGATAGGMEVGKIEVDLTAGKIMILAGKQGEPSNHHEHGEDDIGL